MLGNLGDDILSKMTLKSGVGTIVETGSDDGHFMALRGPVTLRHMRFRLAQEAQDAALDAAPAEPKQTEAGRAY